MLKFIAGTFATRFLAAIIFFGINILLAQYLGAAGKGQASLFISNMAFIVLLNDIVGGSAITYLASRISKWKLLLPAYVWISSLCVLLAYPVIYLTSLPNSLWLHLAILTLLQGVMGVNQNWLVGLKKITQHNIVFFIRALLTLLALVIFFFSNNVYSLQQFIWAMYVGLGIAVALSFAYILSIKINVKDNYTIEQAIKKMLELGFWVQIANIVQFLNYRLAYYYLDFFSSDEQIGVYSVAMHFVEAIWIISRSIATVQFAYISTSENQQSNQTMTQQILFYSGLVTVLASIVLVIIPSNVFAYIFGSTDFSDVHFLLILLAPGILAISLNNAIANYFAGNSWFNYNALASCFGLIFTVILGYFLTQQFDNIGASVTASVSYTATFIFSVYLWKLKVKQPLFVIQPVAKDISKIFDYLKSKL